MNILTMENITKSFGERKLFSSASFYLEEGEKIGVIGINGTGKSTLLKMIAGLEEPDEGRIVYANHCVIRYLPQNPDFLEDESVIEAVLRNNDQAREADAKAMLTRLGVTDFDEKVDHLSGGQRKRLALVAVLLSDAEILVLDEPTNHLDHEMSEWLEDILKRRRGAVIMVTHDRYFLDSVTKRIIEIDKGSIYSYDADYAGYLELKMQREDMEYAAERKRKSILRNELAWVMRGARARSTKQKARLERYEAMKSMEGPRVDARVEMASAVSRLGRTTVELEHVSKAYGDRVIINDFTYFFGKDDRVGFVGPNGSGKSTLMKMIEGSVKPDSGEIRLGQTVNLGYYSQEIGAEEMNPGERVIDYIRNVAEFVDTGDGKISASKMLERFLFDGEKQYSLLGKLSGGERRRLYLLKVLMKAPNVLILDEPTNDLDIATLQILEDYLDSFCGIVAVVSHDRYFLDRTVRRIFAIESNGRLVQYEGGYTDYVQKRGLDSAAKTVDMQTQRNGGAAKNADRGKEAGGKTAGWKENRQTKLKFTYQEKKDYETIEAEITALEEKIDRLDAELPKHASDFVKLNELMKEKEEAEKLLEEKMDRWMYLEDLAGRIEAESGKKG